MALRIFLAVSTASVLGGILWLVFRWPQGITEHLAGAAMITTGAIAASQPYVRVVGPWRTLAAAAGMCAIGTAAEIAGLYAGFFGIYAYHPNWKPSVALTDGVLFPLLLPVMWFVIVATTYAYARQRHRTMVAVIVGALLTTLLDLVAEPVLTGPIGFWRWLVPGPLLGAPIRNSAAWFVTALVGCAWFALILRGKRPAGREPIWLIVSTLLGVIAIAIAYGELRSLWALVVGLLVAVHWRGVANISEQRRAGPR